MTDNISSQRWLIQKGGAAYDPEQPVTCLGVTFANDAARRAYFGERLLAYLQDPKFRQIEGFPIGADGDILALSDPPYYTACPNPFLADIILDWQRQRRRLREELDLPTQDEEGYHREPFASVKDIGFRRNVYLSWMDAVAEYVAEADDMETIRQCWRHGCYRRV